MLISAGFISTQKNSCMRSSPSRPEISMSASRSSAVVGTESSLDQDSIMKTLPEIALLVIIRHMSARPRCLDWDSYISANEVSTILHTTSHFRAVANGLFTRLNLDWAHEEAAIAAALKSMSGRLRELEFDVLPSSPNNLAHCTGIRNLWVTDLPVTPVNIRLVVGPTVQNFRIDMTWETDAATFVGLKSHCPHLQSISLNVSDNGVQEYSKFLISYGE